MPVAFRAGARLMWTRLKSQIYVRRINKLLANDLKTKEMPFYHQNMLEYGKKKI